MKLSEKWRNWIPEPNTGCHIWLGSISNVNFRPIAWRNGNNRGITRLICEEANGPPPTLDYEAAHKRNCIGKWCINGDHMYWATRKQNELDKSPEHRSEASYKASKSKLPRGIQRYPYGYRVRVNRYSVGCYLTLEEAITALNHHCNKG